MAWVRAKTAAVAEGDFANIELPLLTDWALCPRYDSDRNRT